MFDAFMAAAPAIAFVKDPDGRYLHANRQLLEQFGDRLGSDWFGRTDADIWPADIAALVHASDVVALAADAPIQVTQLMPIGDTQVPILVTKFPIHTLEGVQLGGIGLDITHERALAVVAARHAHQRALIADTLAHLPAQATSEATAQMICRQVVSLSGVVTAAIMRFAHDDRAWPMGFALANGGSPISRSHLVRRGEAAAGRSLGDLGIGDRIHRPRMHDRSWECRCDRHVGEPPFPPSFSNQRWPGVSPDVGREGAVRPFSRAPDPEETGTAARSPNRDRTAQPTAQRS